MYEIPPSEPLATLIETYHCMGGPLEYIQIGLDAHDLHSDQAQLHKNAAIFTVQTLMNQTMHRLLQYWNREKARLQKDHPGITQSTLYRITEHRGIQIRPDQAHSQQVPPARFFALPPPYDKMQELPSWLDITIFAPAKSADQSLWEQSYPYAFLNPLYGLSHKDEEIQPKDLFQAINRELFGDDINHLTIHQWSTNWADFLHFQPPLCSYSALWTLSFPSHPSLLGLVIATSE